jgi:hypothetical protein
MQLTKCSCIIAVQSTERSAVVVYTAQQTNSRINEKIKELQFRICGNLSNISFCMSCKDFVATKDRLQKQNCQLTKRPMAVYFAQVSRYYAGNTRKPQFWFSILIKIGSEQNISGS